MTHTDAERIAELAMDCIADAKLYGGVSILDPNNEAYRLCETCRLLCEQLTDNGYGQYVVEIVLAAWKR